MKYLRQFLIIVAVSCVGEILKYLLPLPIPASIYGLVNMLGLLLSKKLKLDSVKEAAEFLVDIMPVMFIPAAVGLMVSWNQLAEILVPVCVITVVSSLLVMIAAGKATDYLISRKEKKNHE